MSKPGKEKVADKFVCHNQHTAFKADIIKPDFKFQKNCQYCLDIFLQINFIDFCIFCNNKVTYVKHCGRFRNICIACLIKKREFKHLDSCKFCQVNRSIDYSLCDKCSKWYLIKNIYEIPVCTVHKYCKNCLGTRENANDCRNCAFYFENIGVVQEQNIMVCNLCSKFPDSTRLICAKHYYCKSCTDLLLKSAALPFPNVTNCKNCVNVIKILKQDNLMDYEVEKKLNLNEGRKSEPFQNLRQSSRIHFFNSKVGDDPSIVYRAKSLIVPNRDPSDMRGKIEIIHNKSQPESSKVPSNKTSELENKAQIINFEKNPIVFESNFEDEDCMNLSAKCSFCKVYDNTAIGFLCNHNYCTECLVLLCAGQIVDFINSFNHENEYSINSQFQYICQIPNCKSPLQVPTKMIILYLESLGLNQIPLKKIENFDKLVFFYQQLLYLDIQKWIPYFDGIKYKIFARLYASF